MINFWVTLSITLGSFAGAYFIYIATLYLYQERLLFHPPRPDLLAYRKLREFEADIRTLDGIRLQGWAVPGNSSYAKKPLHLIYFGGNGQEASTEISLIGIFDFDLVSTFNYRGYGLSEGTPSELSLYNDALEVYDAIDAKHPDSTIILMGHSLGSAIAGHVARERNPKYLILSTPLHSIEKLARSRLYIPPFVIKHRFSLYDDAKYIQSEVVAILAKDDDIIPNHDSYEALSNIPKIVHIQALGDSDHNSLLYSCDAKKVINNFIKSIRAAKKDPAAASAT